MVVTFFSMDRFTDVLMSSHKHISMGHSLTILGTLIVVFYKQNLTTLQCTSGTLSLACYNRMVIVSSSYDSGMFQ